MLAEASLDLQIVVMVVFVVSLSVLVSMFCVAPVMLLYTLVMPGHLPSDLGYGADILHDACRPLETAQAQQADAQFFEDACSSH